MRVTTGRMRFSYEDADGERAFHQRRDELSEAFTEWLERHDVAGDPADAQLLMDWKFGYADGALDTWTVPEIGEFLLDWCPRKLSAAAEDCADIPGSVAAFVEFLAHHGLLGRGSQSPSKIRRYCERTAAAFVRKMADPANFGMAKSLFSGVGGLRPGADLDPESVAELLEWVRDLPPEIVDKALGQLDPADFLDFLDDDEGDDGDDGDDVDDEPAVIGPVRLPSDEERLAAVRAVPQLRRLRALAAWCPNPGRPLTAKGNLRLADARHLVDALDTGDVELGGRRKLTSATDLPALSDLVDTALAGGVVRRQKGRLVAVARFAELDDVAAYEKVVRGAVEAGLGGPGDRYFTAYEPLWAALDAQVRTLLAELLAAGDDGSTDDMLVDLATELVTVLFGRLTAFAVGVVARRVGRQLDRLAALGVVATGTDGAPCPDCARVHRTVTLTAAGTPIAVELVREAGFEVVVRPDPAVASADQIVDLLGLVDPPAWEQDAVDWFAARPDAPAAAADLLRELCAEDRDPHVPAAGLGLAGAVLGEHAVTAVRAQLGGPRDGLVLHWLLAHGAIDPAGIDPARLRLGVIDMMVAMLDVGGPADVVAGFQDRGQDDQLRMLAELWRLDHPRLDEVLDVLGAHHPVKAVAKTARRTLMKLRSRVASR